MRIKYYGDDKETDQSIERMINREVFSCQSSLVDELMKTESLGGFDWGDIENLYPDVENMDAAECAEYCDDYGIPCDDLEDIDEWREAVRDGAEAKEVFEWYLVSAWLADKLDSLNEPLLKNGYGTWWGRTCTGQAIALDPTFYRIHATTV